MAPTFTAKSSRQSIRLYNPAAATTTSQISHFALPPCTRSVHRNSPPKPRKIDNSKSAMVVPLGPGKFYGSSLPRPRIYTDTKLNPERVDPPLPVMDPLLSWANEAHWSMGGLSFKRLRLQGRIEGSVTKLPKEREKFLKTQNPHDSKDSASLGANNKKRGSSVSPPPAPVAVKRRRFLASSDEEEEEVTEKKRASFKRKLVSDFDRVATTNDLVGVKTRSKGLKAESPINDDVEILASPKSKKLKSGKAEIRTSPRLAKRGSK